MKAIMRRENGMLPDNIPAKGRWVLRDENGKYVDHDRYSNDLLVRHNQRYEIELQRK